jgi:hypothetical protein
MPAATLPAGYKGETAILKILLEKFAAGVDYSSERKFE